jgi:hypothetical protein
MMQHSHEIVTFEYIDLGNGTASPIAHDGYRTGEIVKCCLRGKKNKEMPYLAMILEIEGEEAHLKFLHRSRPSIYCFPQVDDMSWESLKALSRVQPQPVEKKRQRFVFQDGLDPIQ